MRTPLSMAGGGYTLPGMNEYTIVEKKFRVPGEALPQVWLGDAPYSYLNGDFTLDYYKLWFVMHNPRPDDKEIVLTESEIDAGWSIIWPDEPDHPDYVAAP